MKKTKLIVLILFLILTITGITYSWFTWVMPTFKISGTSECFDLNIKYTKGQDIGSDNKVKELITSSDYKGGLSTSLTVALGSSCTINNGSGTVILNTDSATSSDLLNSGALKYQVMSGTTELGKGVISSVGKMDIASKVSLTKSPKSITVYVWIDINSLTEEQLVSLLNVIYKGSISMKVESGDN